MGGTTLATFVKGKDLGIVITPDIKVSEQVIRAAAAANSMLGRVGKSEENIHLHGQGNVPAYLQNPGAPSHGVRHTSLVPVSPKGYHEAGEGSEEGYEVRP